jgi:hypothetical protein
MATNQTMEFHLPDFSDPMLRLVVACGEIPVAGTTIVGVPERLRLQTVYQSADQDNIWLQFTLDVKPDLYHFHFDVRRESPYIEDEEFANVNAGEIFAVVSKFEGAPVELRMSAEFVVPLDAIPKWGLIRALRDVRTESCGTAMSLTGATFELSGGDFAQLRFQQQNDDEKLCVSLTANTDVKVDADYLPRMIVSLKRGLDCFVLETERMADERRSMHANA